MGAQVPMMLPLPETEEQNITLPICYKITFVIIVLMEATSKLMGSKIVPILSNLPPSSYLSS